MRKHFKTLLLSILMGVISLCFGGTVMAATTTGTIMNGFTWTMDGATQTLTIGGKGSPGYESLEVYRKGGLWEKWQNQIRHIVLLDGVTSPGTIDSNSIGPMIAFRELPQLETYRGSLNGGFQWLYETKTATLTINGKGDMPVYALEGAWVAFSPSMKHLVLGDGITRYATGQYIVEYSSSISSYGSSAGPFETITIGKGLREAEELRKLATDRFLVSAENQNFSVYDGALYSKDFRKLILCPIERETLTLHKDTETLVTYPHAYYPHEQSVQSYVKTAYVVPSENKYFSAYEGALYSKDFRRLIAMPTGKTGIQWPENLTVIGEAALMGQQSGTVVLPWGVTTLETFAFSEGDCTVVLPDTVGRVGNRAFGSAGHTSGVEAIFSRNNPNYTGFLEAVSQGSLQGRPEPVDSVASYYNLKPNQWKTVGDRTYYFDSKTVMAVGNKTIDGKSYFFDEFGALQTTDTTAGQWKTENGKKYYYGVDGKAVTGFFRVDGATYYFDQEGAMATGLKRIDGKYYYLNPQTGVRADSKWLKAENKWFYLNSYGAGVVSCWRLKDGKWAFLKADGVMAANEWVKWGKDWYYQDANGYMTANKWVKSGGKWYYLSGNGVMAASKWVKDGKNWYYLNASGVMLTNTTTPDGYRVNASGVMV